MGSYWGHYRRIDGLSASAPICPEGKPQAGLPFLNSGAILGYLLAYAMVYQNLNLHAFGL